MSATPRTIAPCSTSVACTKFCQSSTAYGLVTKNTTPAVTQARSTPNTARKGTRPSSGRPSALFAAHARHTASSTATTGTTNSGSALNLDETANPMPSPVTSPARSRSPESICTAPNTANTVKVVLAGSIAKKWLS